MHLHETFGVWPDLSGAYLPGILCPSSRSISVRMLCFNECCLRYLLWCTSILCNGAQSSWALPAWLALTPMRIHQCFPALTVCAWEVSVLAQGCVWAPYPCLWAGLRPLPGPLLLLRHEPPALWPKQTIRLTPNPLVNRLLATAAFCRAWQNSEFLRCV